MSDSLNILTQMVLENIQAGAPVANRNFSQDAVNSTISQLQDKGYDKDTIEAAKVFMGGSQKMIDNRIESALATQKREHAEALRNRDCESTFKSVLKDHYADPEYGAQLKKMEPAIRQAAIKKYFSDTTVSTRWGNGEYPESELEQAIDDVVDEFLKDVLGKDRKSNNTAINAKPTSSEGAVAGNENKTPAKSGPSGDFDRDLASLSSEQRQMFDAKLIRLTQRLGRDPEKAKKEALESAMEMPAYFPTRGLTANI